MKKLLHISLGNHNTNMWQAFNKNFITTHYDWTTKQKQINQLNSEILQIASNFKPDICFFQLQRGGVIDKSTIKQLSNNSITVLWNGDVRMPIPNLEIELCKLFDLSLFTNNHYITSLSQCGVNTNFLQVGFDPNNFNPKGQTNQLFPKIVFCGGNYTHINNFPLSKYRHEMVSRLKQNYKNDFDVFGNNWKEITQTNQYLNLHEEATAYRTAKIGINLSHFNYGRYTSDRLLRMMGAGCLVLSHNYKEIDKDFKIGKHLDTWNSFDELIQKIDYYLKNPILAQKIAKQGCKYVHKTYTWNHFCIELKKMIGL